MHRARRHVPPIGGGGEVEVSDRVHGGSEGRTSYRVVAADNFCLKQVDLNLQIHHLYVAHIVSKSSVDWHKMTPVNSPVSKEGSVIPVE